MKHSTFTSSKVSVILPAYNAENFLEKAIKSILWQTYTNLELIIINDGSKDSTEQIILSFKDKRLRYIKNESNLGLIKTLNKGFTLSSGKYIARMDADDISHPRRIEEQVAFLERLGSPALLGTNILIINKDDKIIKVPRVMQTKDFENHWVKYRKCPLHHPTVMFNREIIEKFGEIYQIENKHIEDYAAWIRINDHYPIYNLNKKLLFYRVHESNISAIHNSFQIEKTSQLLTDNYFKLQGTRFSPEVAKCLLFLKKPIGMDLETCFKDILRIHSDYIKIYPANNFPKKDIAYSIVNIGLKSGTLGTFQSIKFAFKNLGIGAIFYALKLITREVFNLKITLYFYKIKFSSMLRG